MKERTERDRDGEVEANSLLIGLGGLFFWGERTGKHGQSETGSAGNREPSSKAVATCVWRSSVPARTESG